RQWYPTSIWSLPFGRCLEKSVVAGYLKDYAEFQFTSDSKQDILNAFIKVFKRIGESGTINIDSALSWVFLAFLFSPFENINQTNYNFIDILRDHLKIMTQIILRSPDSEGSIKAKRSSYLVYFIGPGEINWELKEDSTVKCNSKEILSTDEELLLLDEENPQGLYECFDD
ncbi:3228_t:CDS:2, partial [Acaulospora morrowiae]